MNIKKILWATDGSKESEEALSYAVYFAKKFNAEIIGVHVITLSTSFMWDFLDTHPDIEPRTWMDVVKKEWNSIFAKIKDRLIEEGVKFHSKILKGGASRNIIELANSENVDLIVMGVRGLGLIDKMFMIGSTALKVLHESDVPVLTVHKRDRESQVDIRNILVPTDLSENIDTALHYGMDLASELSSALSVVYVTWISSYAYDIPKTMLEEWTSDSSKALTDRIDKVKGEFPGDKQRVYELDINGNILHGRNPGVVISDYASRKEADLIVINTHGRKGVKRLILGSVAEKVIKLSECPVLILKPK